MDRAACLCHAESMSNTMPGSGPWRPTSYVGPLVMLLMGVGFLALGWWANAQAEVVRATDMWAYNSLAAVALLTGALFLPFAGATFVRAMRNRKALVR